MPIAMIDRAASILTQGRLIFALVGVFVLAGLAAYLQMDRQENPSFPYRAAILTVPFPGAGPERVERLVAKPLEDQLAEIPEISKIITDMRQGVGVFTLQLGDQVYDTDAAWDRVRVAMDDAAREYPDGVGQAQLDDRIIDASLMVLAITGDAPMRKLADAAKTLRRHLLGADGVASTTLYGDPGRQITIAIEDAALRRNGLSPSLIARDIRNSNQVTRGGTIKLGGASVNLEPETDFTNIQGIRDTAIALPAGGAVPLSTLAHVYQSNASPPEAQLWYNGERAVAVEVVAERGANVVELGKRLRASVASIRPQLAPLSVHEMFYEPAQTEKRLDDLSRNLLISVLIILAVLFLFMGFRLGVVVAVLLPLVTLTTLALYALGGGILHQIAIIGLVVSLGILVDNAIVMSENVQWRLNGGEAPSKAAAGSIRDLAGPLFAATGTTLAAFVPMLLSKGNTADFTRALPVTIMTALTISYLFAVSVTPLICQRFLKPQPTEKPHRLNQLGETLGAFTMRWPVALTVLGIVIVAAAMISQRWLDKEFFPQADRTTVVVDMTLPEGTHLSRTAQAARTLEAALRQRPGVTAIHTFVGNGGPKFFYNLREAPQSPQLARLVVETDRLSRNQAIIDFIDRYDTHHLVGADIVAKTLSQGPITNAPIEVRVFNPDAGHLVTATEAVFQATQHMAGARDVRHDLGTGVPSVKYTIHDSIAQRFGVSPIDVADTLASRSEGLVVGQYRGERDPMPIKLRSPEGETFTPTALQTANVYGANGDVVPLMQAASARLAIQPGAIRHYNQRRVAHVYSELQPGAVYSQVLEPLQQRIADLDLPAGTRIEYGGNAEESGKANDALFRTAPLGIALLLFFLLIQFNSFIRVLLVLLTAPFALVGVIPGLLLLGIPFGFMPLLGAIALTGIVVNNAIVLIDVIDVRLAEGAALEQAIADAVARRTRPILLTTATTIAGLLPLALSGTTLWPPMAWPLITGLAASTVLTLLVLPAICRLVLPDPRQRGNAKPAVVASMMIGLVLAGLPLMSHAAEPNSPPPRVSFTDSLRMAGHNADVARRAAQADAAHAQADRARRAGRYPTLSASAFVTHNDSVAEFNTNSFASDLPTNIPTDAIPDVSIPLADRNQRGAQVELRQPILNLAQQLYGGPSADHSARAAQQQLVRQQVTSIVDAAQAYVDALSIEARLSSTQALVSSLTHQTDRLHALRDSGRALKSDVLEAEYALAQAQQQQTTLMQQRDTARAALGRAIGQDSPVRPTSLNFTPPGQTRDVLRLIAQAHRQRHDLASLEEQLKAARLARKQIAAQRLPQIDAVASTQYNDGNVFQPDHANRIAAQLTWRPFAGGTLLARSAEARANQAALHAQRLSLRRGIAVQVRQALGRLDQARRQQHLAKQGVESANQTRDTRAAQLESGRSTTSDVLEAEATLADRRAEATTARYQVVAAWVALQGTLGDVAMLNDIAHRAP